MHLVGPVTSDAAEALSSSPGKIYLPYVITSGVPLLVWAVVLVILAFGLAEGLRWLLARQLPEAAARQYREAAAAYREPLAGPEKYWYWSGLTPFAPPADESGAAGPGGQGWEQKIARTQFLARAPHDATWLLWAIVTGQLIMAGCVWQLHIQPPVVIRNIGVALIGLALPAMAAWLYSAWSDTARRPGGRAGAHGQRTGRAKQVSTGTGPGTRSGSAAQPGRTGGAGARPGTRRGGRGASARRDGRRR
jgi:hypothetical protein